MVVGFDLEGVVLEVVAVVEQSASLFQDAVEVCTGDGSSHVVALERPEDFNGEMTQEPRPLGLKASLARATERRRAGDELVEHVTASLGYLQSRPGLRTRHFAAMSLARLTRLVKAMDELVDRGFADVVDVVGRSALETFALGLYVLYGGDAAYDHVRGAHVRQRRALPDLSAEIPEWRQLLEMDSAWDGPTEKIVWEELITRRLPELVDPGDRAGGQAFFQRLYGQAYRFGSMAGTHAGIGTIAGHHLDRSGALAVRAVRHTADDGTGAVVFGATLLALLASHVFQHFGVSSSRCEELLTALTANPDIVMHSE